jgi:hypothetical protein
VTIWESRLLYVFGFLPAKEKFDLFTPELCKNLSLGILLVDVMAFSWL